MKRPWGDTTTRILTLLQDVGAMTRSEVCRHLGMNRTECAAIMSRLIRPTKRPEGPKRVHIAAWVYDEEGQRHYPRAVYALGNAPDVRKPKPNTFEVRKRYRERSKLRVASVFDLGLTRRQHRERRQSL